MSRHMGNEFDDLYNDQIIKLDLKQEMYQRYADDTNVAQRSIGRRHKFCPLAGRMIAKSPEQIRAEADVDEDELTMRELKNIADSLIDYLETEYDCPTQHPELGMKVPVLDLALWVEEVKLSSQGWTVKVCIQTVMIGRTAFH